MSFVSSFVMVRYFSPNSLVKLKLSESPGPIIGTDVVIGVLPWAGSEPQ